MLTATIKADGRILIPVSLRRAFGATPDEPLVVRMDGNRLILERRADVLRRIQERFAQVPDGVSLADELIAERRAEAARER